MSSSGPPDQMRVPPGHQVKLYGFSADPSVARLPGGAILAQFGFGGDDPDEAGQVSDAVAGFLREPPATTTVAVGATAIGELFAPSSVRLQQTKSLVVWTARWGDPGSVLEAGSLDQLLERMRGAKSSAQTLVVAELPAGEETLSRRLQQAGINLVAGASSQPFLAEVGRPDRTTVTGFIPGARKPAGQAPQGPASLFRAPLLRRLILQAAGGSWRPLHQELLRRRHPLLFIVDGGNRIGMMNWPGAGPALPIFGDLRSLLRTAAETGRRAGAFGIGGMPPAQLFAHALKNGMRLAFNAFPDKGAPQYALMEKADLAELAAGRLPRGAG